MHHFSVSLSHLSHLVVVLLLRTNVAVRVEGVEGLRAHRDKEKCSEMTPGIALGSL